MPRAHVYLNHLPRRHTKHGTRPHLVIYVMELGALNVELAVSMKVGSDDDDGWCRCVVGRSDRSLKHRGCIQFCEHLKSRPS